MSTHLKVLKLIADNDVRISDHGYDELANDNLSVREIISGAGESVLLEDYPEFKKGSSILVLQKDKRHKPIHVVWGIPFGFNRPAVLITAYRPNPEKWTKDYTQRK